MDRDELLKLIQDDEYGLLTLKSKASSVSSADERLVASFREIVAFIQQRGKAPEANRADMNEMQLYSRLKALREDEVKAKALRSYDELGLLGKQKKINSIEDVFDDDDLGILNDDAENIFDLKHVPAAKEINLPDYIAKRQPCKDFANYEHLFKQCQSDLSSGKRKMSVFSRGSLINQGDFFVLKGVLVYVADVGARHQTADRNTFNARLRCLFENATESDMLMRSLAAALYKEDGLRVSAHVDHLLHTVNEITDEDQQTGYVYVLRSLSEKEEIKALKHLYKIGFSRGPVEERLRNASQEATYLMAPVSILTVYQCYNINPQKLELLLHTFFGSACLQVDIIDGNGHRCVPKEWFIAPLSVITRAVELVITREIVNYRYNAESQQIESR